MITEFTLLGLCLWATSNEKADFIKSSKSYIHEFWRYYIVLIVKHRNRLHHCVPLEILRKMTINSTPFA